MELRNYKSVVDFLSEAAWSFGLTEGSPKGLY
jgi:hypothetical protein